MVRHVVSLHPEIFSLELPLHCTITEVYTILAAEAAKSSLPGSRAVREAVCERATRSLLWVCQSLSSTIVRSSMDRIRAARIAPPRRHTRRWLARRPDAARSSLDETDCLWLSSASD